jgi:uncharacterized phage protein (TIGR01671 family)
MNRIIKFRAWVNIGLTPFMDGVTDINFSDMSIGCTESSTQWFRGQYEIMQFTGLHDKNGKEIYEGDIVSVPLSTGEQNAVVFWGKYSWCLDWQNNTGDELGATGEDVLEVIGNLYEHPELLTGNNGAINGSNGSNVTERE